MLTSPFSPTRRDIGPTPGALTPTGLDRARARLLREHAGLVSLLARAAAHVLAGSADRDDRNEEHVQEPAALAEPVLGGLPAVRALEGPLAGRPPVVPRAEQKEHARGPYEYVLIRPDGLWPDKYILLRASVSRPVWPRHYRGRAHHGRHRRIVVAARSQPAAALSSVIQITPCAWAGVMPRQAAMCRAAARSSADSCPSASPIRTIPARNHSCAGMISWIARLPSTGARTTSLARSEPRSASP